MKIVRWILLPMAVFALISVAIVNFGAPPIDDLPPPDRSMVVAMPDGSDRTLGELVDVAAATTRSENSEETEAPADAASPEAPDERSPEDAAPALTPDDADLISLAEFNLASGDTEVAIALLRSVPKDHPQHGKAMRRLGWDCYTRAMDQPGLGVSYVNASLRSDPWDGNAWQDAYRVYLNDLGLRVR